MRINSIDYGASHQRLRDTMLNYSYDGKDGHIQLTFSHEDPDVGVEEMLYNGEGTFGELASDLRCEISSFLDHQNAVPREAKSGIRSLENYLEGFTRTALIAFETILKEALNL